MEQGLFTTQQLPVGLTLRRWQDAMERHSQHGFIIKPSGRGRFFGSLQSFASPRHRLVVLSMSSHEAVCDTLVLRRKMSRPIMLTLLKAGSAKVTQDGREAVLSAGDLVLINTARPLVINTSDVEAITLDLDRAGLLTLLPAAEGLTCVRIAGDAELGTFLRSMVLHIAELASKMSDAAVDHLIEAVPHVLAAAFCDEPKSQPVLPRHSDALHRHRIQLAIRDGLKNSDLCPELIASQVGVSERYLHKLFNESGQTLMAYVWSQRLAHSKEDLENQAFQRHTIAEVARRWGFKSAAHFSRAFKKKYGQSAGEVRKSGRARAALHTFVRNVDRKNETSKQAGLTKSSV
jgi:AraC-like DNA-binding protein